MVILDRSLTFVNRARGSRAQGELFVSYCPFQNALLQETSEEWEQCERKMKEVKTWIEKAKQSLESPQNKKKPLRDQHIVREKMLSDVAIQKTKIGISMEKLQVHFRSGIGGDSRIGETVDELLAELDSLHANVKEQTAALEACLAQIDQYQQVRIVSEHCLSRRSRLGLYSFET